MALIALVHLLRVGRHLQGSVFRLYYGYFSDVALPFGMYFLLCLNDVRYRVLRHWYVKAIVIFGLAASMEVLQGLRVRALGRTFDPLDFVAYGGGVLLAASVDRLIFARLLPRWTTRPGKP
jgi:hypothetical protein